MALKATDFRAILTAPQNIPLVVARVMTNDPGLDGPGCAACTQRFLTVASELKNK